MRIREYFIALVLCIGGACCSAAVAHGTERNRSVTLHAFGSYQKYGMADVNEAMRNALAAFPGSTADKEKIDSGGGFGGGVRIWTSRRLFLPLELHRILASNSGSGTFMGQPYEVELNVPAFAVTTGIGYVLFNADRVRLALSGGVGYYLCTGEVVFRSQGLSGENNLEGSGFGFHGLGHVLARVTRRVDLELAGGYRYAKTTDLTSGGQRYRNSDGSLAQVDWSGVTGRAGLSVRVSGE